MDERGYLLEYDKINVSKHYSHGFRVQASGRKLLIAFRRANHYNILELQYSRNVRQVSLVRYFKFRDELRDIFIQQGELVAFGTGFIGMFPLGIHPKLIKQ
mgnify:CR=1 FL=1